MGQRVRVQNFTVSADGYATGEGQSLQQPFGHADPAELIVLGLRDGELARRNRRRRLSGT